MVKATFRIFSLFILIIFLSSWGSVGHGIINSKSSGFFPASMVGFQIWSDSLATNSANADNRKDYDSGLPLDKKESYKHYIDIDDYSEFLSKGRIASTYDSIVAIHGSSNVIYDGTLPWATMNMYDTLVVDFKKLRWHKAMLDASDLGHYVADGHMPLHITKNYDGQSTGQTGIHSRYEGNSNMVGKNQIALANYTGSPNSNYVSNVNKYIFNYIYSNYRYKDSVLLADSYAKNLTGSTSSSAYYTALWNKTQFTNTLFRNASHALAELIYSAWVDAGSPPFAARTLTNTINIPADNISVYPNPSSGSINVIGDNVSRTEVCTITGSKVAVFYNRVFDISYLPNGMYILSIYGREGLLKKEKILLAR